MGAIRAARGHVRAYAALTPEEQANKALVYKYKQRYNFNVVDKGDRCYLLSKTGPPPNSPVHILLDQKPAQVQAALEATGKLLGRKATPPPTGTTPQPATRRTPQPHQRWAEVATAHRRPTQAR